LTFHVAEKKEVTHGGKRPKGEGNRKEYDLQMKNQKRQFTTSQEFNAS